MFYRILTNKHYPDEWDDDLLMKKAPYPEKNKKDIERWERDSYNKFVGNDLDPDWEREKQHNFYYFQELKLPR